MSGAELATLRPRMEDLHAQGEAFAADVASLERRLDEAIANADKAAVQLRAYSVEVGEVKHRLNSLRGSIVVLLDELDTMAPSAAPSNSNAPRKKGGGA